MSDYRILPVVAALASVTLLVACGGQSATPGAAGAGPAAPAGCPAVTPLVLPTPVPGSGPGGEVVSGASRITVDLRDLKSDSTQRDNFIKMSVMQVEQYPLATFVPSRAQGLPNPLPANGSATFTLVGPMTVHGVTKEQTWNVTATRQGSQLSGTATTSFKFGDYGMAAPRVPMVLSVVDDIRLEVAMVAASSS